LKLAYHVVFGAHGGRGHFRAEIEIYSSKTVVIILQNIKASAIKKKEEMLFLAKILFEKS
jgi:hypothetical protein